MRILALLVACLAVATAASEAKGEHGLKAALSTFTEKDGAAMRAEEEAHKIIELVEKTQGSKEELGEGNPPERTAKDAARLHEMRYSRPNWQAEQQKHLQEAAQLQATYNAEMATIAKDQATETHKLSEQAAVKEEARAQQALVHDHAEDRAELEQAMSTERKKEDKWMQAHQSQFQKLKPELDRLENALGEVGTDAEKELKENEAEVAAAKELAAAWQGAQTKDSQLRTKLQELNVHGGEMVKDAASTAEQAASDMRELMKQTSSAEQAVERGTHWDAHKLQTAATQQGAASHPNTLGEARVGRLEKMHKEALEGAEQSACETHGQSSVQCHQAQAMVKKFADAKKEAASLEQKAAGVEVKQRGAEAVTEIQHEAHTVRSEQRAKDEKQIQADVAEQKAKFADGAQAALEGKMRQAKQLQEQAESTLDRAEELAQWQAVKQRQLQKQAAGLATALEKRGE